MKKKITVVSYDPNWKEIFKYNSNELKEILNENCVTVYHVGSTSVPGLCAKPVVDIMCVVKNLKDSILALEKYGYKYKGEYNLPLRLFFSRKKPHDVHIHLVKENSGEINWNLVFQNYLRENEEARDVYAKIKLDLINENPDGFKMIEGLFSEYTIKKGEIIREISRLAGFSDYRFVIAANYNEIDSYKKLMNLNNIDFNNKNVFHLCLYKGVEIVAAACVEFNISDYIANINSINSINNEDKNMIKEKINEWVTFHNLKLAKF